MDEVTEEIARKMERLADGIRGFANKANSPDVRQKLYDIADEAQQYALDMRMGRIGDLH